MTERSGLRAVLFDMDGLLVDSERLWLRAERETVADLGGTWTEDDQLAMVGGSLMVASRYMVEMTGTSVPADEVSRRLLERMADLLSAEASPMPGAKELLAEVVAAGIPAALVSSSHRRLVDTALAAVGADAFTLTLAGDEVTRTKPDPEPYLTAASRLGVRPAECVVLEDSPNGVAAGEAAGCVVVAVPGLVTVPEGPKRTVVRSLRDVDVAMLRGLVPPVG